MSGNVHLNSFKKVIWHLLLTLLSITRRPNSRLHHLRGKTLSFLKWYRQYSSRSRIIFIVWCLNTPFVKEKSIDAEVDVILMDPNRDWVKWSHSTILPIGGLLLADLWTSTTSKKHAKLTENDQNNLPNVNKSYPSYSLRGNGYEDFSGQRFANYLTILAWHALRETHEHLVIFIPRFVALND